MKKPNTYSLDLQLFAEEQKEEQKEEIAPEEQNAIEALKAIKEKSVSKEKYDSVVEQNRKLWDSIVNGRGDHLEQEVIEKRPEFDEVVKKLSNTDSKPLNNLEYWKTILEFRKQVMERGYPDPAVPHGRTVEATPVEEATIENQLNIIQQCIDKADNDPVIFNQELSRRGLK